MAEDLVHANRGAKIMVAGILVQMGKPQGHMYLLNTR